MKLRISFAIAAVLVLCLGFAGCGLYVVKKSSAGGDHQGIPFYVKTAGCKREITRLKPYYLLTLTTKSGAKTNASRTAIVCRKDFASPALDDLRKSFESGVSIDASWDNVKKLQCEPRIEETVPSDNWLVVSDVVSSYAYVDYSKTYTLNVRRPVIGSASATTKLAEDGTLAEGTGQMEDKTLSTVLGLVPTADLIKSAAGVKTLAYDGGAGGLSYELKIEEKGVKFTRIYRDPEEHRACELGPNLKGDLSNRSYDLVVEDAGAEKKPADDNTIKVSGSIELPKAKDSTKPANSTAK